MFTLNEQDTNDLLANIELGWAKLVKPASFTDEADNLITFCTIDGRVFRLHYNPSNTITTYHEVVGENLDLFNIHYGAA